MSRSLKHSEDVQGHMDTWRYMVRLMVMSQSWEPYILWEETHVPLEYARKLACDLIKRRVTPYAFAGLNVPAVILPEAMSVEIVLQSNGRCHD